MLHPPSGLRGYLLPATPNAPQGFTVGGMSVSGAGAEISVGNDGTTTVTGATGNDGAATVTGSTGNDGAATVTDPAAGRPHLTF